MAFLELPFQDYPVKEECPDAVCYIPYGILRSSIITKGKGPEDVYFIRVDTPTRAGIYYWCSRDEAEYNSILEKIESILKDVKLREKHTDA